MVFTKDSETEDVVVLIKAAPQVSKRHGETVCCAGITPYGEWRRLYPVSFRHLPEDRKFRRWDRLNYRWEYPKDDKRKESRRIDAESLTISGKLKREDHWAFLEKAIVDSTTKEAEKNHSLALLAVEVEEFFYEKLSEEKYTEKSQKFESLNRLGDLFGGETIANYRPCPYEFKYKYRCGDGLRTGTCQDWEIEATYHRFSREYGEKNALNMMAERFGDTYPKEGMVLAMGTHSRFPDVWLINGVIKLKPHAQQNLF